jgi:hypothetical protein
MKKIFSILSLAILFLSFNSKAQIGSSKIIAGGVKLGVPNIVSLNGEFIPPILGSHFSIYGDYSKINTTQSGVTIGLNYLELGSNFYITGKGKGIYIGIGKSKLSTDLAYNDLEIVNNGFSYKASAATTLDINTTNFKLGYRTGGTFYFRFELGFGFSKDIPKTIEITAKAYDTPLGTLTEIQTETIPEISGISFDKGIPIGSLGFGLAF